MRTTPPFLALLSSAPLSLVVLCSTARAQEDAASPVAETPVAETPVTETPVAETSHEAVSALPPASAPVVETPVASAAQEAPVGPLPQGGSVDDEFGFRTSVELGFLSVLSHELTLGTGGTRLDYPTDFNQSNLYLFARVTAEFDIWRQHLITFVYQPIDIESSVALGRDVRIDGLDFARGTPVRARYGFPFYRLGWAFDVLSGRDEELAFGLGLQLRNATIEFRSEDGTLLRTRNDVGPVPLLRARGRFALPSRFFFAFEVDGFYAFIPGINGSDNNVEGAILDASLRLGWRMFAHTDAFFNVRYIGGGAAGTGDPTPTSDGFQRNWLHFLSVSIGATFDSRP
jgi:hypothetical protein